MNITNDSANISISTYPSVLSVIASDLEKVVYSLSLPSSCPEPGI